MLILVLPSFSGMLRWCAVLLLLVLPGVQACADTTPQIDLAFPDDADCSKKTPDGCPPVPEADEPLVLHGEFIWSWTADACTSGVVPSLSPVHVSFESIERTAHGWLTITTEPREIFIPPEQQWDVTDDDPNGGTYRAEERYPLDLIVSLVGEPSPEAIATIESSGGAVALYLKASTKETPTFLASFALQQVLLDGQPVLAQAHSGHDAPAPSFGLGLLALGLAAVGLSRRR
jgi:hypothetical protein